MMATSVLLSLGSRNVVRSVEHVLSMKLHVGSLAGGVLRLGRLDVQSPSRVAPVDVICHFAGDCWLFKHLVDQALPFVFLVDNVDIQAWDFGPNPTLRH